MILTAGKYKVKFTALSISNEIKLQMPMWKHPGTNKIRYQQGCRRKAATCLRLNHGVRKVADTLIIANPKSLIARKPHQVSPSGIGRKNCGCPSCYCDRHELGCDHPGECIETAKILIHSLSAKWNPTMQNLDLCEDLSLTDEEREGNKLLGETDQIMVYDPDYSLRDIANVFRVFAFEDSLTELPGRRYKILDDEPI
jgi:hypothetical protein